MRREGVRGAKRREKPWRTTQPALRAHGCPALINRDFHVARPNQPRVADISYLRYGKACCSSRSSLTRSAGRSPAGSSRPIGAAPWYSTRSRWRSASAAPAPTSRWRTTMVAARPYARFDYIQTPVDHRVLQSVGSVGDGYKQCPRRELRRQFQDGADRRSRLAHRARLERHRRVHRLVQPRPPSLRTRLPHPSRTGTPRTAAPRSAFGQNRHGCDRRNDRCGWSLR
jgi:hypothetical protein